MTKIRNGAITLKGTPTNLAGPDLKVGDAAPDFNLQNNALEDVSLNTFAGKTLVIATVPSLDTPVCHAETIKFNQQAEQLTDTQVLVVSTDLPFGQKRWCGAENVSVTTLSDHRNLSFAENYGVLIKELRIFARAMFVVDANDTISYVQIVPEIAEEPDYDKSLQAAQQAEGAG